MQKAFRDQRNACGIFQSDCPRHNCLEHNCLEQGIRDLHGFARSRFYGEGRCVPCPSALTLGRAVQKLFLRRRQKALALKLLAGQLAGAAHGLGLFAGLLFRRLFIGRTGLHFTKQAFALHFLLQHAQCLLNIVIPDEYLHCLSFDG